MGTQISSYGHRHGLNRLRNPLRAAAIDYFQSGRAWGEAMKRNVFLVGSFVIAGLFGAASPAFSQSPPPSSDKARQVEALVEKAAALIESKGKAAFADFRVKNSEWFHGDTYLFVYDLKSNVLLNPAFPAREGTSVTGQKDANGKLFHDAIIQTAETKGSGWVDYMFPKPGQTTPSQKWAYVQAVKIDGVPGLVASGFYPE